MKSIDIVFDGSFSVLDEEFYQTFEQVLAELATFFVKYYDSGDEIGDIFLNTNGTKVTLRLK